MKKVFLLLCMVCSVHIAKAQSELPTDTLRRLPSSQFKDFDGFLIDMSLIQVVPKQLPKLSFNIPNATKNYNQLFLLNNQTIYTQGTLSHFNPAVSSFAYGWNNNFSGSTLQIGSFTLKNGMRLNTYGDYNREGWKVPNRNPLPWKQHNFRGAFELKSENGSFGIRLEVQRGGGL